MAAAWQWKRWFGRGPECIRDGAEALDINGVVAELESFDQFDVIIGHAILMPDDEAAVFYRQEETG